MNKCKVVVPFTDKETGKTYNTGDAIELSNQRLAEIRSVNVNMVSVLEKAQEEEKVDVQQLIVQLEAEKTAKAEVEAALEKANNDLAKANEELAKAQEEIKALKKKAKE